MPKKKVAKAKPFNWHRFGHYAFVVGILLAVALALIPELPELTTTVILVILGLLVGLFNIQAKETNKFMLAALVLMVSASVTALSLGVIHTLMIIMWGNVIKFIAPAAIVVAVKVVLELAEKY